MLTRDALLRRIWWFVRDGLVYSGAGWVCCPPQAGCGALPGSSARPTRQDVRRCLDEIEQYLAAHA